MFRLIPHRLFIEPRASVCAIEETEGGVTVILRIDGLLCSACAANVRGRLEAVDGVGSAQVDLERGEARVHCDPARGGPDRLIEAVEGAVVLRPLRRLLGSLAGHGA